LELFVLTKLSWYLREAKLRGFAIALIRHISINNTIKPFGVHITAACAISFELVSI